jgi:hypothetical protein
MSTLAIVLAIIGHSVVTEDNSDKALLVAAVYFMSIAFAVTATLDPIQVLRVLP